MRPELSDTRLPTSGVQVLVAASTAAVAGDTAMASKALLPCICRLNGHSPFNSRETRTAVPCAVVCEQVCADAVNDLRHRVPERTPSGWEQVVKHRMGSLTPGKTRSLSSPKGVLRSASLQPPRHAVSKLDSYIELARLRPIVAARVVLRSGSLRTAVSAGIVAGDTAMRICNVHTVMSASGACDWQILLRHTCTSTGSARIIARPSAIVLLLVASGSWLPALKTGCPARSNALGSPAGTSG